MFVCCGTVEMLSFVDVLLASVISHVLPDISYDMTYPIKGVVAVSGS